MSYVLSEDAERDLHGIWDFIAADNTPAIGHRREDLTVFPVLFWPVGAYLIIYRATSLPVEIVAVTQGARDIPAFLQRRISH
jgi:plasmid stabilization system protein ParE